MSRRIKTGGDEPDRIFGRFMKKGDLAKVRAEEAKEREDHWRETCETLLSSPAFREWFEDVMLRNGGMEFDRPLGDVAQGQMLMLAKLRDSLKTAPSAPRFFGELMEKHYRRLVTPVEQ